MKVMNKVYIVISYFNEVDIYGGEIQKVFNKKSDADNYCKEIDSRLSGKDSYEGSKVEEYTVE